MEGRNKQAAKRPNRLRGRAVQGKILPILDLPSRTATMKAFSVSRFFLAAAFAEEFLHGGGAIVHIG
jgi:hypothetical protein